MNRFTALAERLVHAIAHPATILVVITAAGAWPALGGAWEPWDRAITAYGFVLLHVLVHLALRDGAAEHAKLSELIKRLPWTRDEVADVDRLSEREIEKVRPH